MMKRACVMFLVLAMGCGSKDDKGGDKKADKGGGGDLTAEEYEKKNTAMGEKALPLFKSLAENAGKDCDKDAAAISKLGDEIKADNDAVNAYEKAHPDAKKAWEEKHKDLVKEFREAAMAVFGPCKDNKAMKDAVERLR